jgi:GNAT superfamily N-acetyltransferase
MTDAYEIRQVAAQDILWIRQKVLRPHQSLEECQFPEDMNPRGFHLGLFLRDSMNSHLISIASFHPQLVPTSLQESLPIPPYQPYRLRGMATLPEYSGRGYGAFLVKAGEEKLKEKSCDFLWFNAREKAFRFYSRLKFNFFGELFDIEGVGPHKIMYKSLRS